MNKLLLGAVLGGLGVYAWHRAQTPVPRESMEAESAPAVEADDSRFHCDGRTRCSQMTSCEEATYFLRHCPGVKMDGEGDGVPCERQWCGRQ